MTPLDLPPNLRDKIKIDTSTGHWIWTGAWMPPRTLTVVPARAPESRLSRVNPKSVWLRQQRGVGRVWDPTVGYAVDAHRAVFAAVNGLRIRDRFRLKRCACETCVNPNHAGLLPVQKPRQPTLARPRGQYIDPGMSDFAILTALKTARPYVGMSAESCAAEAGCPVPSEHVMALYRRWDAENPD